MKITQRGESSGKWKILFGSGKGLSSFPRLIFSTGGNDAEKGRSPRVPGWGAHKRCHPSPNTCEARSPVSPDLLVGDKGALSGACASLCPSGAINKAHFQPFPQC